MAKAVQRRRGSAAEHTTFTGLVGELTVDTDDKRVVVHDGSTAGGIGMARESELPAASSETVSGKVELATAAETLTGTDNTRAVHPAGAAATFIYQGLHQIGYWPARALKTPTTNGAVAVATVESATNKLNDEYLSFVDGSTTYATLNFRAPKGLDESAVLSAEVEWTEEQGISPLASSHVCRWQAESQAQGDGDTMDSAWGTAAAVDDTGSAGTRRFTALIDVTPAGSWAAGDKVFIRIGRLGGHANDTLNSAAWLIGVSVFATVNAKTDA